ncbi:MAG: tyrosine/phenylalanine carboxypeptidase domain-containing protein, partial [Burkholderiaceae bacterium]
ALAAVFGRALTLLGAQGWSVELDAEMTARVAVAPRARRIRIRTDARFAPAELRRLTVHEVGCHVARYENARRQPLELLVLGLGRYLSTEEGLAVWCERHFGVIGAGDERRYAARLVAVDLALAGSFSQVYGALRDVLPASEAYDLCVRVRRGIADQSGAGAYVKDRVYLEGCAAVGRHLAEHPLVTAGDHWRRPESQRRQLCQTVRVVEDIDDVEFDIESRKKLFRPEAARSARLGEEADAFGLCHGDLLGCLIRFRVLRCCNPGILVHRGPGRRPDADGRRTGRTYTRARPGTDLGMQQTRRGGRQCAGTGSSSCGAKASRPWADGCPSRTALPRK